MAVPAVISLVTLGVRDVPAATRFYESLGFERSPASVPGEVSFFHTGGAILAVWGTEALRSDAQAPAAAAGAFRGVSLAVNVESRAAVDEALRTVEQAGGHIARPAQATEWGGYLGYFTDLDGHYWEVAHNPSWPLGPDGLPQLPR
jgi:predicted lactoylglutathione lyase